LLGCPGSTLRDSGGEEPSLLYSGAS
jgi:hypothetical protein